MLLMARGPVDAHARLDLSSSGYEVKWILEAGDVRVFAVRGDGSKASFFTSAPYSPYHTFQENSGELTRDGVGHVVVADALHSERRALLLGSNASFLQLFNFINYNSIVL